MDPPRRRRRPALACTLCRRRKVRCNRESPCNNCIRANKTDDCVYTTQLPGNVCNPPGTSLPESSSSELNAMKMRIRELESKLKSTALSSTSSTHSGLTPVTCITTPESHTETTTSHMAGTFLIHHGDPNRGQMPNINRSITHKNRMFGQSHWVSTCIVLVRDVIDLLDDYSYEQTYALFFEMQKCKHVSKLIKAQRIPEWPCSTASELPSREVADALVEQYLSTSEILHRVLHVPSFRSSYAAIWETGTKPDPTFLILLKLVLAIGAGTYDNRFTLRTVATRWKYEAEIWLSNPTLKHRLGLEYFQIYILLLVARDVTGSSEDTNWVSAGGLFRAAIYMGLHRDPVLFPQRTIFANEMHRRLWNTILELCLQTSLNAGAPPLLSLDDFDTRPPGNYNDDQLIDEAATPKPDGEYTDISAARELRNTFSIRLTVIKFLNCIGASGSYQETLRLDAEFRSAYKDLRRAFQSFQSSSAGRKPQPGQLDLVEVVALRYLVSLHMPFFSPSLHDPTYAHSRKVVVDSSLKMWYTLFPDSTTPNLTPAFLEHRLKLRRMVTSGSGFFRFCMMQILIVFSTEFSQQTKDEDSLGIMPQRPDFLCLLKEGIRLNYECIEAGETNVKGYVFAHLMCTNIELTRDGMGREEVSKKLISMATKVGAECLTILQEMLASMNAERIERGSGVNDPLSFDDANVVLGDWDFTMLDGSLGADNFDFMTWMFDTEVVEPTAPW